MIERLIAEAEGQSRPVLIAPTANADQGHHLQDRGARRGALDGRRHAAAAVRARPHGDGAGDRQQRSRGAGTATRRVAGRRHRPRRQGARLRRQACRTLAGGGVLGGRDARPGQEALGAVRRRRPQAARLEAQVLRAEGGPRVGTLHAMSARGQRLGEAPFKLGAGETRALATFDLPLELGTR